MKYLIIGVVIGLLLLTPACGSLSSQGSDTTQSQGVTGDNAQISSKSTSKQVSSQARGASIEGSVESVLTENNSGISTWMFILGVLILGMIIPQPKFLKVIW